MEGTAAANDASNAQSTVSSGCSSIILFYKYHPLSPNRDSTELYRQALEDLCVALQLQGRILLGCSTTEGLNGTLAGSYQHVFAFTQALLSDKDEETTMNKNLQFLPMEHAEAVDAFRCKSRDFFASISEPELRFDSPDDFKWSTSTQSKESLFPDLTVKLVSELIGTGGVFSSISLQETSKGYLTPKEWHDRMVRLGENSDMDETTVLIDCRNAKEYEIGHFQVGAGLKAINPKTTTFGQFPKWVNDHKIALEGKSVMMYCR
jgi:predicted sulfurtransferase